MKKFKFTIQGSQYEVNVLSVEDNTAEVELNGQVYKVELEKPVQQTKTPRLVRSAVSPSTESSPSTAKTSSPASPKGVGHVKSPLPGVILHIHVKEGETVKIGDRLMTLEAMKMENNINADKEGVIRSIKVKPGDAVLEGDLLLEIGGK